MAPRKSDAGDPGRQHVPSSPNQANKRVLTVDGSVSTRVGRRAARRASQAMCSSRESEERGLASGMGVAEHSGRNPSM